MAAQNADGWREESAESAQNVSSDIPPQRVDPTKGMSPLLSGQAARFWIIVLVVCLSFLALLLHALHKSNQSSDYGCLHCPAFELPLIQIV